MTPKFDFYGLSARHNARAESLQCDSLGWRPRKRVLFFMEACKAETNPRLYRPHRLRAYRPGEKILLGACLGLGPPAQAITLRAFSPKGERKRVPTFQSISFPYGTLLNSSAAVLCQRSSVGIRAGSILSSLPGLFPVHSATHRFNRFLEGRVY